MCVREAFDPDMKKGRENKNNELFFFQSSVRKLWCFLSHDIKEKEKGEACKRA